MSKHPTRDQGDVGNAWEVKTALRSRFSHWRVHVIRLGVFLPGLSWLPCSDRDIGPRRLWVGRLVDFQILV